MKHAGELGQQIGFIALPQNMYDDGLAKLK
jgi:hypothetical protein